MCRTHLTVSFGLLIVKLFKQQPSLSHPACHTALSNKGRVDGAKTISHGFMSTHMASSSPWHARASWWIGANKKNETTELHSCEEERSAKHFGSTLPQTGIVALQLSVFSVCWASDTAVSQRSGVTLWSPSTGLRWPRAFPHQSCTIISLIMNFYSFFRAALGLIGVWGKSYRWCLASGPRVARKVVASCSGMCVRLEGGHTSATWLQHWRERGWDQKMDMK